MKGFVLMFVSVTPGGKLSTRVELCNTGDVAVAVKSLHIAVEKLKVGQTVYLAQLVATATVQPAQIQITDLVAGGDIEF